MAITRHVGHVISTGTRCVVVFRELPGEIQSCLVYEADSMHEFYREPLTRVTMKEGQKTRDLYEVLNRHTFPDGQVMLTGMHKMGYLRKYETANIMMHIDGNTTIRLDNLNTQIRDQDAGIQTTNTNDIQDKFNPYEDSTKLESMTVAQKLVAEADKLEQEAASKRKRAHALDPAVEIVEVDNRRQYKIDIGDMPADRLVELFEELSDKLGIQSQVGTPEGHVAIDMKVSQRQMLEAAKAEWRAQNPDKIK